MLWRWLHRGKRWCAIHGNRFGVVPIFVYQMAKVGSSSIVDALQRAGHVVFHLHRMDAAHLTRMREHRRGLGWSIPPIPEHDLLGLRLRRDLIDRGGRAKIVTLVRDPIARNLSSYFEHLDFVWQAPNAHASVPLDRLIEGFHTRYTHDEPLTWFDDELLPVAGIDVYDYAFPDSGTLTITTPRFEVLVLKSELSDEIKTATLADFLGVPISPLAPVNRTMDKAKGEVYRAFVDRITFDDEYVERMLGSRYARHFYSNDEREAMRRGYRRQPTVK